MLVNFIAIGSILLPFRIYGHLIYFVVILVHFPVSVCCAKKNLATPIAATVTVSHCANYFRATMKGLLAEKDVNLNASKLDRYQGDQIGRISPLGRLITLGSSLEVTKVAHIFGPLDSTEKVIHGSL
jgi:hypothetical protein